MPRIPNRRKSPSRKPQKAKKTRKAHKTAKARTSKSLRKKKAKRAARRNAPTEVSAPPAMEDPALPIRGQLLNDARDLTLGDRNKQYGDPLENFEAIAILKRAFWEAAWKAGGWGDNPPHFVQNSPWGHAIDMVFNNLGRIASAPTLEATMAEDRYKDGINYLAIAYEIAKRTT